MHWRRLFKEEITRSLDLKDYNYYHHHFYYYFYYYYFYYFYYYFYFYYYHFYYNFIIVIINIIIGIILGGIGTRIRRQAGPVLFSGWFEGLFILYNARLLCFWIPPFKNSGKICGLLLTLWNRRSLSELRWHQLTFPSLQRFWRIHNLNNLVRIMPHYLF
jgi:hypothetical protein